MNYKKKILLICSILCIFFAVSTAYASDVNITYDSVHESSISQNYSQSQLNTYDDGRLSISQDDDILAATSVYFDASAAHDGDGSRNNPYKYLKNGRIGYGTVAYFADGIYELSDSLTISSSSTYKTIFVGESIQNTIIRSKLSDSFDFIVSSDSYFALAGLTLDNIHINNQATLVAENVSFVNSVGFTEDEGPSLPYLSDEYDSTYGGVIISNAPRGKENSVYLNRCSFINDCAVNGGVIAAFNSYVSIQNCIFYNSSSTRFGGVVYSSASNVVISNSSFSKNKAGYGGVIYSKASVLKVFDSDFRDSQAYSFGGVIVSDSSDSLVYNSIFNNYQSLSDAGGAIYSLNSTLNVYDSSFTDGKSFFGGAICNLKSNFTLLDSRFSRNFAVYYGGTIYNVYGYAGIQGNTIEDSHADSSGGAICSRLSDSLYLNNNTFVNSTAAYGHIIFVDGDAGSVVEKNNVYQEIYNLVCLYSATLNGEEYVAISNYLTFSVSSNGVYVVPLANDNADDSNYVKFNISVEGNPSPIIYTDINQNNRLLFDLEKYGNKFENEFIEAYIIDEAGDIIYSDVGALTTHENHISDVLFDLNFKNFMILLQYGNLYDINPYSSVPLFNYTVTPQSLPVSYDSRDYGYITPVKDQKRGGNCWAFSGIATLEACLKKATGITYDFSEENAKNLMAAYSLFGWDIESNDGGNLYMFMAYLASWFGPVNDDKDVYDDYSSLSVIYDPALHIQNIYCIPERKNSYDNDLVKKAIMDCGAVSVSTKWDTGSHAITLVGWDDEYTGFDYFNTKSTGAWIFKNSWGEDWYDNGYFYMSYEKEFKNAYTFIFNEDRGYSDIYQYDFSGVTGYRNLPSANTVYSKNKFISSSNDILTAVSTFFYDPTNYSVSVYLNGNLITTQEGYTQAGYYTFPLDKEIQLAKGDEFVVEFKCFGNNGYRLPVCMANVINKVTFSDETSFYSTDGKTWYDLYYSSSVACIKAFTRSPTLKQVNINVNQLNEVKVNEIVTITATIPEYYVVDGHRHYLNGFITFNIDGTYFYAPIKNGKASLNISFSKLGTHSLTAYYKTNLEISNVVMFNFNVVSKVEDRISLKASDVSKYYGGSQKYVVSLTNNDLPVSGASVKITVDNKVYTVRTNSTGQAVLDLTLASGTYNIVSEYGGKSVSSKFIVKSTIDAKDASGLYLQSFLFASFLDTEGNLLSDKEVIFRIGNTDFRVMTSAAGYVLVNIPLDAGSYNVTVINPITGEQKRIKLDIFKRTVDLELTAVQNAERIIITATLSSADATGNVNFFFNGNHYVNVVNGTATWELINLDAGTYDILASYSGNVNFYGTGSHLILSVVDDDYTLDPYNVWMYYGEYSRIFADVVDENNCGVSGQTVRFTIQNKTYIGITDSKGRAYVQFPGLDIGNYTVLVQYGGQSSLSGLEVRSTISSVQYSGEYLKSSVTVKFVDDEGKGVVNKEATFKVGTASVKATTDVYGFATAKLNLDVGFHTVTAINPVTGEKKEFEIQITKANPQITLSRSQSDSQITLTASLTPVTATGNVIFTVGSNKYAVNVKNGKAALTLTDLSEGSYTAVANYVGDNNFNNAMSSLDFIIVTPRITISAPDLVKMYNGVEPFIITVKNNNNPVVGEVVKCTFDGEVYNFPTNSKGIISIDIEDYETGEYAFVSEYGGVSVTSKITILSTISAMDVNAEYSNAVFKASFMDSASKILSNTGVFFNIAGKQYSATTNSNGVASVNVNLNTGSYSVIATNPVTGEQKQFRLNILKSTPEIALQYSQKDGTVSITASITPQSAEGYIVFNAASRENTIPLENGKAVLDLMGLDAGSYTVSAKFIGNSNYKEVSSSLNFTVSKINPVLTLKMTTVDDKDALMASLSYSSATGTITFIVDGNQYPTGIRNGASYLTFSDSGVFNVLVKYSGDNIFNPVSKSIKVSIEDKTPVFIINNLNKVYGDSKTFTVRVLDYKENPISAQPIQFAVYDKNRKLINIYKSSTDTEGYAKLTCNFVPNTYYIKVDDTKYVRGEAKLVIKKATPKITASAKTFKVKLKTKSYTITLKSNLNKVLKSKKVTLKVGGKTYKATTNSKGKATFKITKLTKKGKFTAVVKFGDAYYNTISKNVKITVK